ncbi:MAG: DNA polymerase IV [Candidatus Brocadiaceae bacterium]|jgi:nucleotidyltransferase/DNA polymerase involved in DNA repair
MADRRVIIHVDMDAFFAAVEQRDDPELQGKPVVVGADPEEGKGRGVVSTCSYEARQYGVHSAQPISEAYRRCPHAVFLPVDGAKYGRESRRIRRILEEFTPQMQPVSIDEAFLDVTGSLRIFGGKRALAACLQERIEEETGLTASLGVAPNKLVAKIASDLEKPRGLTIVEPEEVAEFLRPLEVERLPGVGPKMRTALGRMGIRTIGELADVPSEELEEHFGEWGRDLWRKARGHDDSPVSDEGEAKSIGHEHTFARDTSNQRKVRRTLIRLCEKTARRLRKAGRRGHTVMTKVRFEDFTTVTRQTTVARPVVEATELFELALANLAAAGAADRRMRLVGVTVSNFAEGRTGEEAVRQTDLFGGVEAPEDVRERLARAEDAVKDRFGEDAVRRGASFEERSGKADEE